MKNIFFGLYVSVVVVFLLSTVFIYGSYADTTERTSTMVAADTSLVGKKLDDINASVKDGIIYGTVTDDNGNPVFDATVMLKKKNIKKYDGTDGKGRFQFEELAAGTYKIYVKESAVSGHHASNKEKIKLEEGEELEHLLKVKLFRGRIYGYVISNNTPLKGEHVYISHKETGIGWDDITDEEGFFQFDNLKKGKYLVTWDKKGFKTFREEVILSEDEEKEIIIEMEEIGD